MKWFNTRITPIIMACGMLHCAFVTAVQQPTNEYVSDSEPSAVQITGTISYLDLGVLSGQLWGFMEWWPEAKIDMVRYRQYLSSMFSQLKNAGVRQLNLSFAQIGSINALANDGVGGSSYDVIVAMMNDFPGALQELIRRAQASGIRIDLSFGGENGTAMQICASGETPEGQAQKLAQFMLKYKINAIDFDIENTAFSTVNTANVAQRFFKSLKQKLNAMNKTSTLTIPGGIQDWPLNYLKPLFFDESGSKIFQTLFNELNLMLFSQTQYYLDANHVTWGIEQWLDIIGKENAKMLHIGFEDAVNYALPSASAGGTYEIDTQKPGVAAAEIYQQLLQKVSADGYPTTFGNPFFWPDNNRHDAGTWSRYQAINKNGVIVVRFAADMMKDYFLTMQSSL